MLVPESDIAFLSVEEVRVKGKKVKDFLMVEVSFVCIKSIMSVV